jgi:hypothetical protein
MTSRHVRLYGALLRSYPRRFHAEYRDEMTRLFADQLRDARSTEGTVGVARLWARSLVDLVSTVPGQHVEAEKYLVASPVGATARSPMPRAVVPRGLAVVVALMPLWLLVGLYVVAPGFLDPVYAVPPAIAGLPAGIVLIGIALGWMAIGVGVISVVQTVRAQAASYLLFAVPAATFILFIPATSLIIQNLEV